MKVLLENIRSYLEGMVAIGGLRPATTAQSLQHQDGMNARTAIDPSPFL